MTTRIPAPALLAVSAVFHYLGPAFAVLLFAHVDAAGVAWLRIVFAALVFAVWRRPWRVLRRGGAVLLGFGAALAAMNTVFYLAIERLPLATVGAIEFLGVVVLAAAGVRGPRNAVALVLAIAGVALLTEVRLGGEPLGLLFAFLNCGLFMVYVTLGHRLATETAGGGVDRLGAAMLVASVVAAPVGVLDAAPALVHPTWLLAGLGVAVCSSVIPYVADQLAMARVRRSTFALMLSVLPASATVVGLVVLAQLPTAQDVAGIALVAAALAVHRPPPEKAEQPAEAAAQQPAEKPAQQPAEETAEQAAQ
ncbi:EamA family transporter [Dactylosporangium sp. NPDC005572]|uniref:EamA family transporter n=1 Tax=Dactylosporangium sp. NPDC005572 TaxID=3156889 RepID=UPI0033B57788